MINGQEMQRLAEALHYLFLFKDETVPTLRASGQALRASLRWRITDGTVFARSRIAAIRILRGLLNRWFSWSRGTSHRWFLGIVRGLSSASFLFATDRRFALAMVLCQCKGVTQH